MIRIIISLYKASVCSILTYGSEAWLLDDETCKIINGANAYMLSHIAASANPYVTHGIPHGIG